MATSRTKAATLPEELQRQSGRIDEQLVRLSVLLDIITERLDDMSRMMTNYSPDLVRQFGILKSSLNTYKVKANSIYGGISNSLLTYANNLLHYLNDLAENVTAIENSIKEL